MRMAAATDHQPDPPGTVSIFSAWHPTGRWKSRVLSRSDQITATDATQSFPVRGVLYSCIFGFRFSGYEMLCSCTDRGQEESGKSHRFVKSGLARLDFNLCIPCHDK